MILLDFSQIMIANIMMHVDASKISNTEENLIRHMALNSLRSYRSKFKNQYGELVICCDDKNFWRKDVFPHYKANRKKNRESSKHDWGAIFETMDKIKQELKTKMPYKVIQIDRAEADDIIASICHSYGVFSNEQSEEKILILSADKDFTQLQKYSNVDQFSPTQKKQILTDNPERFLREHILFGDRGDGVPNFLSDDDTFVSNKRQKMISRKKVDQWATLHPKEFCDEKMLRGYIRNEIMVNLDKIPNQIQEKVLNLYNTQVPVGRSEIMNYFMENKLKTLTEHMSDF